MQKSQIRVDSENKDSIIQELQKKLEMETEVKMDYQKKSSQYMIDYIKAEKQRKEIEIYTGIKNQLKKRRITYFLIVMIIAIICLYGIYLIIIK